MNKSAAVETLVFQAKAARLPTPEREVKFHPTRRWKADLVFQRTVIVEVDGGTYKPKSGHTTGKGYEDDREKDAHALMMGFQVLRVTTKQVKSGEALHWLTNLLNSTNDVRA